MNKVYTGKEMQESITKGVNLLADTVKVTLGAKGQFVGIDKKFGGQHLTKDGVTVAREVACEDSVANFAIKVIRESAQKSASNAGDGTTTVTVLSQSIYNQGRLAIESGIAPISIQRSLVKELEILKQKIEKSAVKVEQDDLQTLTRVATISANNDEVIGKQVASVISKVGLNGIVTVEEQQSIGLDVEYASGMRIDRGFVSPYFINQQTPECILEDCYILVTDRKISLFSELENVLLQLLENKTPNLLVIAEDFDIPVLESMVRNHVEHKFNFCAIKNTSSNDRVESLKDIAALVGARYVQKDLNKKLGNDISVDDLGFVKKIITNKNETLLIGAEPSDVLLERVSEIKAQASKAKTQFEKAKVEQRLANLTGNVAILKIGSATEVETKEIKDRLEDSIRATQAALEEGYLAGGGVAYLNLIKVVRDPILKIALRMPMTNILENAGYEVDLNPKFLDSYINASGVGVNVLTNEEDVHMVTEGIIDPAKVVRQCLENSISVASQLLLTKVVIINEDEKPKS